MRRVINIRPGDYRAKEWWEAELPKQQETIRKLEVCEPGDAITRRMIANSIRDTYELINAIQDALDSWIPW